MELTIRDITVEVIKVDNLAAAICQCRDCMNGPYKMPSGHTVRKPRLHAETAACLTETTATTAPITGRRHYIRRKKIGRFPSSDFSVAMIIGSHSEQPIIRPLQSSFSDAGNKRFMAIERELITIANKDIDKGKTDQDFDNIVQADFSIVIKHSVIGIRVEWRFFCRR